MRSYRVRSTEIIEIMRVSLLRSLARTASVNAVLVPGVSNRHHSPGHGAEGQMYAGQRAARREPAREGIEEGANGGRLITDYMASEVALQT